MEIAKKFEYLIFIPYYYSNMGQTISDCTSKRHEPNKEITFGCKHHISKLTHDNLHYLNIIDNCDLYVKKKKHRKRRKRRLPRNI